MQKFLYLFILLNLFAAYGYSQKPKEERIVAELSLPFVGSTDLEIILKDSIVFIPTIHVFNFLGIKNEYDSTTYMFKGFFKNPDTIYTIDPLEGVASLRKKRFEISAKDYIISGGNLYLNTTFLNTMFDLGLAYNSRKVKMEVKNVNTLPSVVAAKRHSRLQAEIFQQRMFPEGEMYYGRTSKVVGGGRFDWTLTSQYTKATFPTQRYTAALGMQLVGGDLTGRLQGYTQRRKNSNIAHNNLHGQWRLPFFNNQYLTQFTVGDQITNSIQPRFITGFEITNRPLAQRITFSREVFHSQFGPNADIEMTGTFVKPQSIQAGQNGSYDFEAPILYGQGIIEMNAYDSWGQVQTVRYRMNVPRTVLPSGEFEYSLTAGRLRPPFNIFTSSNSFNLGLSSALTVGTKLEWYDLKQTGQKIYPALTATSLLTRSIIFAGQIAPAAFSKLSLNWLFPSNAELLFDALHFSNNNFFNPTKAHNELNLKTSFPVYLKKSQLSISMWGRQTMFEAYREREIQASLSMSTLFIFPSISSRIVWRKDIDSSFSHLTTASVGAFLPAGLVFRYELSYNHLSHQLEYIRSEVSTILPNNLQVLFYYFRIPPLSTYSFGIRLQYSLPFSRMVAGMDTPNRGKNEFMTIASGSIAFDPRGPLFYFQNRPSYVGYGGLAIRPFYDANNNGTYDKGEEIINKGKMYYRSINRNRQVNVFSGNNFVLDHIPVFEDYDVSLDPQSLDNPLWVPQYNSIRILSEPNYIKRIDLPLIIGGTVRGIVSTLAGGVSTPAEGIKVTLSSLSNGDGVEHPKKFLKSTTTFSTGEFEFTLLPPGKYQVELDGSQLYTLGYKMQPSIRQFEIVAKPEGDIVENQNFVLTSR